MLGTLVDYIGIILLAILAYGILVTVWPPVLNSASETDASFA